MNPANYFSSTAFGAVDSMKVQAIAKSLYDQVSNGSIKLGKVNRNHIIRTTLTVLQMEFNLSINADTSDNLFDYVAATFLQTYKTQLVPHYASLLCPDIDTLKQLYPDFQPGSALAEGIEVELPSLLAFANEMVVAVQIFSPVMQLIVDIVTVCVEGEFKKYINGSGATATSRRRFQLFRRFKPVSPRFMRRGSGSSCGSVRSDDCDDEISEVQSRRRSRSGESVCSLYTDIDTTGMSSHSPSPTRRARRTKQPASFPKQVNCVPEFTMPTSVFSNFSEPAFMPKPSYINSLFPEVDSYSEYAIESTDSESSSKFGHYSNDFGSMLPDSTGLEEFVELFAADEFDGDFMMDI